MRNKLLRDSIAFQHRHNFSFSHSIRCEPVIKPGRRSPTGGGNCCSPFSRRPCDRQVPRGENTFGCTEVKVASICGRARVAHPGKSDTFVPEQSDAAAAAAAAAVCVEQCRLMEWLQRDCDSAAVICVVPSITRRASAAACRLSG